MYLFHTHFLPSSLSCDPSKPFRGTNPFWLRGNPHHRGIWSHMPFRTQKSEHLPAGVRGSLLGVWLTVTYPSWSWQERPLNQWVFYISGTWLWLVMQLGCLCFSSSAPARQICLNQVGLLYHTDHTWWLNDKHLILTVLLAGTLRSGHQHS